MGVVVDDEKTQTVEVDADHVASGRRLSPLPEVAKYRRALNEWFSIGDWQASLS
jgi:hypothetical protein